MSVLMTAMEQSEYLLDIDKFDLQSLIKRFGSLELNAEKIKDQIRNSVTEFKRTLEEQYDLVLK